MLITRTPLRVSFFGGGTDYPAYFRHHGGETLGATIDKFSYIVVTPLSSLWEHRLHVSYSRTERTSSVDTIKHPSVRACLQHLGINEGVEIHYSGDLPARSGLGSSSSFTVGLLHALHAFRHETVEDIQLAKEAVHVEQDIIGERVGIQDQYTCAVGGIVLLRIARSGEVHVSQIPIKPQRLAELQDRLLLVYTGILRYSHRVLATQLDRTSKGLNDRVLRGIRSLVPRAVDILCGTSCLDEFGVLLGKAWRNKRELSSSVSNATIDSIYDRAIASGALGGKLLGAGSGGFLLFYVPLEHREQVARALADLTQVRFSFFPAGSSLVTDVFREG